MLCADGYEGYMLEIRHLDFLFMSYKNLWPVKFLWNIWFAI